MEIKTEHHTTQKTLFRRVNQIRRANGLCDFEEDKTGYRLHYCDSTDIDNVFVVLKGKDDMPFKLYDGKERCAFNLNKGDVLVYECEGDNKVWFSNLKWLSDLDVTEQALGFTDYGTVPEMVQAGLIIPAKDSGHLLFVTPSGEIKETPQEDIAPMDANKGETPASVQAETGECAPQIFDTLARVFKNNDLKAALDGVQHIAEYCNKKTGACIKTHHVMRRPGAFLSNTLPQLRFGGRWLERAGFACGIPVKVITMKDVVLLVPARAAP